MTAVAHHEEQGDRKSLAPFNCQESVMNLKDDKAGAAARFESTKLPVDRSQIHSHRLLRMIELIETMRSPDGQRTLWQMLVDAGADVDHIFYRDTETDHDESRSPALQFKVHTRKLKGFLVIEDDLAKRGYILLIQTEDCPIRKVAAPCVFLRDLPATIAGLIDDGTRRWNESFISRLVHD